MSNKGTTLNKEALDFLCGLINQVTTLPAKVVDDINLRSDSTFSSVKIYELIRKVLGDSKAYTDNVASSLNNLKKKVVTVLPSVEDADANTLYLIKDNSITDEDVYTQYLLIDGTIVALGRTGSQFPITEYEVGKDYIFGDLVLYKGIDNPTYNIYRCISAHTATNTFDYSYWEITNGWKMDIRENASNTASDYRLDFVKPDGSIFTTSNLHGTDSVQVPLNGFYRVYIKNDYLVCEVEDDATPPPLSMENGDLYYTVGGTIKYISVEDV